ncbi:acyl-CoA dehydrogenase [Natronobiforma cellulositropha]|uniref:acyl-CoA dehydrogenase n=1 Tax=Natronobiforma cellulositropha TaxID=1679076 RepID=UPI0021D5D698|nr:acyl-CoA dehydrogenase [Natronobiforma cellulositropha]
MTSFKSGSGNLDFGGSGDRSRDEGEDATDSSAAAEADSSSSTEAGSSTPAQSQETPSPSAGAEQVTEAPNESPDTAGETPAYPYFVRRNNVTDERDHRIEVHLRREISSQESSFRNALADQLDTDEISKTDAREFALMYAFQNPAGVAELMREDGFGILDR